MGAKRNGILALITVATFITTGLLATAAAQESEPETAQAIDYDGFAALTAEVADIRADRLVDLNAFNRMASKPNTIILDSRSAEAFAAGHIDGAINLPFSDFTDDKLAALIPDPEVRILIYCNNNFTDDAPPVPVKRSPLALNVPTFINLYGYGYTNVYELGDLISTDHPDVHWVSDQTPQDN